MNKPIRDFLTYLKYERNYSDTTIASYKYDLEKFFRFLSKEDYAMDEVDVLAIRDFLSDEIESGVSKRSCRRRLCSIKHFYKYMVKTKEVLDNPLAYVDTPKMERKYPHALYKEQIEGLFAENLKRKDNLKYRDQSIIELLYYTGIRVAELVNLNMQDVDIRHRVIRVFGKGRKERIVPFTDSCLKTLQQYIDQVRPELLKKNERPEPAVFLNNNGQKLTTRGIEFILKQIEEKTGVFVGLHPHLFRSSFATHLLENGAELPIIQELLGHKSINATQVYTHVTEQALKNTYMDKFPRAHKK